MAGDVGRPSRVAFKAWYEVNGLVDEAFFFFQRGTFFFFFLNKYLLFFSAEIFGSTRAFRLGKECSIQKGDVRTGKILGLSPKKTTAF